ncbi:MAG: hypothetical protein ACYCV6_05720 [Steroidobacteraceae bacterium]|jgi:hypothetical protein
MNKVSAVAGIWIAVVLTLLVAVLVKGNFPFHAGAPAAQVPAFDTPFQAVLLDNGQVYYGKLTGLGTPYPEMTDVYYVVNAVDPTTKKVTHVLVKRGKELHAPTETYLNARHIIMIENVGTSSEIAKLIRQAKSGSPVTTAAPASP